MSEARHGKQTLTNGIHGIVAYTYADSTARLAASGFDSGDLYKVAFQESDSTYWVLEATTPTWAPLGSGAVVITGDLDMDGYSIINVDLVDGVDVSDHGDRHNPDGYDPPTIGTPTDVGDANAAGSANSYVRSDHVHKLGGTVGGDLNGTLPNPTVTDLTITSEQQGSVLYFNGSNWVQLPPDSDGYVLTTHDAGQNPTWEETSVDHFPDYAYNASESESTTTSTSWQQKLRLTTTVTGGTYQIDWCFTWRRSSTAGDCSFRLQVDDSTTLWTIEIEPTDADSNQRIPAASFREVSLGSGSHNIDLDFRDVTGGGFVTVGISQARIRLYRVGD
jgi:hypothetical protein